MVGDMKHVFRTAAALTWILLGVSGPVSGSDPLTVGKSEELRNRFESIQRGTRSWSARFSQTLLLPGLKNPVLSAGRIRFLAPDRLRIDFENPPGEWMVACGERLLLQKPGKKAVEKSIRNDPVGKPLQGLISLLRGAQGEEARWFTPAVARQGETLQIELQRKEGAPAHLPRAILNTLKADTLEVREVTIQLPKGGSLSYAFEGVERNRPVEPSIFEMPAPR